MIYTILVFFRIDVLHLRQSFPDSYSQPATSALHTPSVPTNITPIKIA